MAILLLIAAPTYLLIGDTVDAIVILVMLVPILAVGWVLEARAESALEKLRELTAPTVSVWRDSRYLTVTAEELVPGDLFAIQEGDVVAADGYLVRTTQMMVDESALTGESLPVSKTTEGEDRDVYAGTTVLSGRGVTRVTATGAATRYGAIGTLVAGIKQPPTPLQRLVGNLVKWMGVVAAIFCVAVMTVELLRGAGWGTAIISGVSLAIAAVPEEFPMVYTLYLALGAWRLAKERALVRRLAGVETLGSTTVICSDKTGTLTMGHLEVAGVATRERSLRHRCRPRRRSAPDRPRGHPRVGTQAVRPARARHPAFRRRPRRGPGCRSTAATSSRTTRSTRSTSTCPTSGGATAATRSPRRARSRAS